MGSKHSKGSVRAEVVCILPQNWLDLEHLHLRFQKEAHRCARTDPHSQFFLSFQMFQAILAPICAVTNTDKTQLLAIFNTLDRRQKQKLAVMDFFSGLALVVEGKKSAKFEFILTLLDNGGVKTLNKCELMMVLMAAVRGLAMFKRSPEVREKLMKPLAKRLLGDDKEVLRQHVVDKAMADAEIVFFMNDLGSATATTADGLLAQQAKLTQTMGYIDFQFARVAGIERCSNESACSISSDGNNKVHSHAPVLSLTTGSPVRAKQLTSVDVLIRKLQNTVYPLQSGDQVSSDSNNASGDSQVVAAAKAVDVKKYIDGRCIQRLVKRISDGGLQISAAEVRLLSKLYVTPIQECTLMTFISSRQANMQVNHMAKDQLGLVKCGEIIRIMKLWLREVRKDRMTYWETIADMGIRFLKSMKQTMNQALLVLDSSARTIKILPEDMKQATELIGSNQDEHSARSEHIDHELHYQMKVKIGNPSVQQGDTVKSADNVKFRLGFHPSDEESNPLLISQDSLSSSDAMSLVLDFGLKQEISDEEAIDLVSAVEKYLVDEQVWPHLSPIWMSCQVTVGTTTRPIGIFPVSIQYLRVCLAFNEDFFANFQEQNGVEISSTIRSLFILGELEKSAQEYVEEWLDNAFKVSSLVKRENREGILKQVFVSFDADHDGVLDLQEFNNLQQAQKKSAIDQVGFQEIFSGSQTLSFKQFMACYEHCSAADLVDFVYRLGLGSINDSIKGIIALTGVLFEPSLREIEHLLSPLRWGDLILKKLLFYSRSANDLSYDLQFPTLLSFFRYFRVSEKYLEFLANPAFPAQKLQLFRELLSPPHVEHEKDRVCRSLFCSIEEEIAKTPQQLEFEDLSRGIPAGSSAKRVEMLHKFLDAATLAKSCIETLELVEVRSGMFRIVCEFENLRVVPVEFRTQ